MDNFNFVFEKNNQPVELDKPEVRLGELYTVLADALQPYPDALDAVLKAFATNIAAPPDTPIKP
jgi:hypothetical protein